MSISIETLDGDILADGLQGSMVCDEAINAALRIAIDRDEAVVLYDDDGVWIVGPDGLAEEAS